jgi:lipoprotein signal peptidase
MNNKPKYTGVGLALGAALGAAFGVMAGHVGVWLAIGVAIGMLLGASIRRKGNGMSAVRTDPSRA